MYLRSQMLSSVELASIVTKIQKMNECEHKNPGFGQ